MSFEKGFIMGFFNRGEIITSSLSQFRSSLRSVNLTEKLGKWVYRSNEGIVRIICELTNNVPYEEHIYSNFNHGKTITGPHGTDGWYTGVDYPTSMYRLSLTFPEVREIVLTKAGIGLLMEDLGTSAFYLPSLLTSEEAWELLRGVMEGLKYFYSSGSSKQGHGGISSKTLFAHPGWVKNTIRWRLAYPERAMDLPGVCPRRKATWEDDCLDLSLAVSDLMEPNDLAHPYWRHLLDLMQSTNPSERPTWEKMQAILAKPAPTWDSVVPLDQAEEATIGKRSLRKRVVDALNSEVTWKSIGKLFHRTKEVTYSDPRPEVDIIWDSDSWTMTGAKDGIILWETKVPKLTRYFVSELAGVVVIMHPSKMFSWNSETTGIDLHTGVELWSNTSFAHFSGHSLKLQDKVLVSYDSRDHIDEVLDICTGDSRKWPSDRLPPKPAFVAISGRWIAVFHQGEILLCNAWADNAITRMKIARTPDWIDIKQGNTPSVITNLGIFTPGEEFKSLPPGIDRHLAGNVDDDDFLFRNL